MGSCGRDAHHLPRLPVDVMSHQSAPRYTQTIISLPFSCLSANLEAEEALIGQALRAGRPSLLPSNTRQDLMPSLLSPPLLRAAANLEAEEALTAKLYALAATVNVSHPWATPNAEELDSITFASWWVLGSCCRAVLQFESGTAGPDKRWWRADQCRRAGRHHLRLLVGAGISSQSACQLAAAQRQAAEAARAVECSRQALRGRPAACHRHPAP